MTRRHGRRLRNRASPHARRDNVTRPTRVTPDQTATADHPMPASTSKRVVTQCDGRAVIARPRRRRGRGYESEYGALEARRRHVGGARSPSRGAPDKTPRSTDRRQLARLGRPGARDAGRSVFVNVLGGSRDAPGRADDQLQPQSTDPRDDPAVCGALTARVSDRQSTSGFATRARAKRWSVRRAAERWTSGPSSTPEGDCGGRGTMPPIVTSDRTRSGSTRARCLWLAVSTVVAATGCAAVDPDRRSSDATSTAASVTAVTPAPNSRLSTAPPTTTAPTVPQRTTTTLPASSSTVGGSAPDPLRAPSDEPHRIPMIRFAHCPQSPVGRLATPAA